MLTELVRSCSRCGGVTPTGELWPDMAAADRRVKVLRRREAAQPVRCARCGGPTMVEGRPVVLGR